MNFTPFLRKNASTLWLLVITALIYALLLFQGSMHKHEALPRELQSQERMTYEEAEAREARFRERLMAEPGPMAAFSVTFLLILGGGALTSIWVFYRRSKGHPVLGRSLLQENVPWGPGEVIKAFAVLFFTEACFVLLEWVVVGLFNLPPTNKDLFILTNSLIRDGVVAFYVLYLVTRRYALKLDAIGLTRKDFWLNIQRGFVAYLVVVPFLFLILVAVAAATKFFSYKPQPQAVVDIYMRTPDSTNLILLTLFVAVIGPVIEELFFRGFAYKAFRSSFGPVWAMVGSAALFSVMHLNVIALVPIFLLGVYLAYLYEKTGSLVPAMTAHVLHNLAMVGFTLFFKQYSS